jgi:hypothetical protein
MHYWYSKNYVCVCEFVVQEPPRWKNNGAHESRQMWPVSRECSLYLPYTRFCNCLLDYDCALHIFIFAILYLKYKIQDFSRGFHILTLRRLLNRANKNNISILQCDIYNAVCKSFNIIKFVSKLACSIRTPRYLIIYRLWGKLLNWCYTGFYSLV